MKMGILSFRSFTREPTVEERRLAEEAMAAGHEAILIHAMDCTITMKPEGTHVLWNGDPFPNVDVLIPRARFVDHPEQRLSLLEIFEQQRFPSLNSARAIAVAKNKIATLYALNRENISTPHTFVIEDASSVDFVFQQFGGVPVVLKPAFGTYGEGIVLAKTLGEIQTRAEEMMKLSPRILVQEFIEESAGKDTRAFVVNGEVVAAMERQAQAGEFRSNVELGATARAIQLSEEEKHLALGAVKALGLGYAGVDIIKSKRGPLVLEVNANPGFKTLEKVSGVNVAASIVQAAIQIHARA